jgi:hypothetical protein
MIKLKKISITGKNVRDSLIQENISYLAKIDDVWHVGTFSDQWYGLVFDSRDGCYQLGDNDFQELYAILDDTHDNLEIDSEKIDPELDAIFNI